MLSSTNELQGYTIQATDGDMGKVRSFFFEEEDWLIRYLLVDTGKWLSGKEVLLTPDAVGTPKWNGQHVPVDLTREQVRNSPDIDTSRPLSRTDEIALHSHYNWSPYWSRDPFVSQALAGRLGGTMVPEPPASTPPQPPHPQNPVATGLLLHSTRQITGCYVHATDGDIGHVEDFIVDTEDWRLRYLVVDTRNWLPGKKVLIAPWCVQHIRVQDRQVQVDLPRERLQDSPEYDPKQPIQRSYEERLFAYYGWPKYWQ